MTVQINLAVVFRIMADEEKGENPENARTFVYRVTPRGLEQQIMDACEEATRSVARSLQHLEVYGLRTDRSGKAAKITKGAGDADAPPEELDPESDPALRAVAGPSDADQAAKARGSRLPAPAPAPISPPLGRDLAAQRPSVHRRAPPRDLGPAYPHPAYLDGA